MAGPITGGTPPAVGTPPVVISGTPSVGQVPTATGTAAATWQDAAGGATIAATTNLIKGDGAGNGVDSGNSLADVHAAGNLTGIVPRANGGAGDANGLLKADGAGAVSAASPGSDYLRPDGDGNGLTNLEPGHLNASGTIPNGVLATTQAAIDNSTKLATTAYADRAATNAGVAPDTGWTANADGGDKTSVIPANATLDAMQAALNLVVAGFGDAFVAVADKTKALETALANQLRPNV